MNFVWASTASTRIYPLVNLSFRGWMQFPNITLYDLGAGLNIGPDGNAPQFTIQNFYQFVDNISWVKGKHNLKFGAEYRWYISPQQFTQRERGDYEYNSSQIYLEDLAPDFFGQRSTGSTTYYGNQNAIYWYANDTWRTTQHLTVNLGVRYEYTTTPEGENRQILNAISNTPSITFLRLTTCRWCSTSLRLPRTTGRRVSASPTHPEAAETTSIRAGFGLAYDTLYDNIGILAVPPQVGLPDSDGRPRIGTEYSASESELPGQGGVCARWRQRYHHSGPGHRDRQYRELDPAEYQGSLFRQLELWHPTLVWQELHR